MTLALIIFALALGVILIFLEVFVIPGTTIFGIAGAIITIVAIVFAYKLLGSSYGNLSLVGGFIFFVILSLLGRKLFDQDKLALKDEITAKVNIYNAPVKVGDIGLTHTDLRPNGKGIFENEKYEVYSVGEYIVKDTPIEVIKIESNKIIVKPLN